MGLATFWRMTAADMETGEDRPFRYLELAQSVTLSTGKTKIAQSAP
jgi:hypothetical protein